MLNHLSLFSGYGGFELGLKLAGINFQTILYCEIEPYCQEIIKARIKDGYLDDAPIWDDIRTFRGEQFRGLVDIVTAGVPCQWISKGRGYKPTDDHPDNLWPDTLRIISETRPNYVLLENPSNISRYYYHVIRPGLQTMGYKTKISLQAAVEIGAPHIRERLFVFASHSNNSRFGELFQSFSEQGCVSAPNAGSNGEIQALADATDQRLEGGINKEGQTTRYGWWPLTPTIPRVDDGTPFRVAQVRAAGEGCVPAVVAEFLRRLKPTLQA